jgi:hypothetical protein
MKKIYWHKFKDNIKIDLIYDFGVYTEFVWLGTSPVLGSCEYGNRFQVSVNVGRFVTRLLASPELSYLEIVKNGIGYLETGTYSMNVNRGTFPFLNDRFSYIAVVV